MTRKEALDRSYRAETANSFVSQRILINEIYDSFEQRIAELEAPKTCETCYWYDGSHNCNNENSIAWETSNRVYPDDYCKDYEPKDCK